MRKQKKAEMRENVSNKEIDKIREVKRIKKVKEDGKKEQGLEFMEFNLNCLQFSWFRLFA